MKNLYISPNTIVVEINASQLMTASAPIDGTQSNDKALSRGNGLNWNNGRRKNEWEDEEEEEY